MNEAEKRVVKAAMSWLRWMEKVQQAETWLTAKTWPADRAIPNLLRACDALRKAKRK